MLHATKWATAANFANQGMSAATTLLLAGILGPTIFGTVSLAVIVLDFFQIIVGFGFNAALIQHRGTQQIHLSSVFWLNLILAVVLMLVVMGGSGIFAIATNAPELQPVLVTLSLLLPIQSLSLVQVAALNRKMAFKALAIRSSSAVLIGGIVGLFLAFSGYGVWALVAQQLARSMVNVILLWGQSDWRPERAFSWLAIRELSQFSGKTVAGQFGTFIQNQFDGIIIGLFLGPMALGLYRLADRLVELNLSFFPRAIQSVSLAHFSRIQHDQSAVNQSFLFGAKLNSITTFPGLAYLAGSSTLILSVFGRAWAETSNVISILALIGAAKAIILFAGPTLQALARPGIVSLSTWIGAVANVLVIVLVASLLDGVADVTKLIGISGARALVFCGVLTPMLLFQVKSATGLSMTALGYSIRPACLTALLVFSSQFVLGRLGAWSFFPSPLWAVSASFAGACCTVAASIWFFDRALWQMFTGNITTLLRRDGRIRQERD